MPAPTYPYTKLEDIAQTLGELKAKSGTKTRDSQSP